MLASKPGRENMELERRETFDKALGIYGPEHCRRFTSALGLDFKLSWILGWKYCSGKYELSENHTKSNPLRPKIFMCLASSCPSLTVAAQSETHSLFFIYFLKYTWCSFWSLRMRLFSLILPKPLLRFVIGSLSISHYFL